MSERADLDVVRHWYRILRLLHDGHYCQINRRRVDRMSASDMRLQQSVCIVPEGCCSFYLT